MRIKTPAREIFYGLNQQWQNNPVSPTEGYIKTQIEFKKRQASYDRYFGTSITSAGYRRDKSLSLSDAVTANLELGFDIVDEAHDSGVTDACSSIEAVAFGSIPGWQQSDYMQYWFMDMARTDFGQADFSEFDKILTHELSRDKTFDQQAMDDPHAPNGERLRHHKLHLQAFGRAACYCIVNPINELIQLVDYKRSLGQRMEAEFALKLGARLSTVAPPKTLPHNPELDSKLHHIHFLGVEIPENNENHISIVPQ